MSKDALDALFGKPDYSHIARDASVTVGLQVLDSLIAKMEEGVWP